MTSLKSNHKKKNKLFHILTCLIVGFFSVFTFVGCIGSFGGSYGGSGSYPGPGSSTPSKPWNPDMTSPDDSELSTSDIFAGAIGVYELEHDDEFAFYDNYVGKTMSFNSLATRQFETMSTFLYNTLNRIYGAGSNSASFQISGYSSGTGTRQVNYNSVLTDPNQLILAGLSTGQYTNSDQIKYENALNGGYQISISESGVVSYTSTLIDGNNGAYGETSNFSNYAWVGKDKFTKENITKALTYIYTHTQSSGKTNTTISFGDGGNEALKTYYSNFDITSITSSTSNINELLITNNYLWDVAYFVAYTLIGSDNMANSIASADIVFDTTNTSRPINKLTTGSDVDTIKAFEMYKGYHTIINELINQMSKMSIDKNSKVITYKDTSSNWETTLFPNVTDVKYVYYSDVENVADGFTGDGSSSGVAVGTKQKLKQVIYLPYSESGDFANSLTWFMAFQTEGDELQLKLSYEHVLSATNSNSGDIIFKSYDSNLQEITYDYITFNDEESDDIEFFDLELDVGLANVTTTYGSTYTITSLMQASFTTQKKSIDYSNGEKGEFDIGVLNVYNPFVVNNELTLLANYLIIDFNFLDANGKELSEIPPVYVMRFSVSDTSTK